MPSEIEIEGVRGKQELERECDVEDDRERLKRGRRAFEQERGVEARERERGVEERGNKCSTCQGP